MKFKCLFSCLALCSVLCADVEVGVTETKSQLEEQFGVDSAVMDSYQELLGLLQKSFKPQEIDQVRQAITFASHVHQKAMRKDPAKGPYLCYPLEVAKELVKTGKVKDVQVVVAAILHDTVRSSGSVELLPEIQAQFGKGVAGLVQELSLYPLSAKRELQDKLMQQAPKLSKSAAEVQMANLIYNLKEMQSAPPSWTPAKKNRYVEWSHSLLKRLPESNSLLAKEADQQVQTYWEAQG